MKYERVLAEIFLKPWAILPEKFAMISEVVSARAAGEKLSKQEILARLSPHRMRAAARRTQGNFGAVGVIPIHGVISQRINLMTQISGGASVEKLTAQYRAALADTAIKVIVFDVDSPGGGVEGVPELVDEILKSRGQKKTVAVANTLAASAAYWIASAADELVVAPSSQVGSIGVFAAHEDLSALMEKSGVKTSLISAGKYKTEGNPYEPLSDEARAALQQKVDAFYEMFVKAVAKGRGVSQANVREGFGQGRLVLAADAVRERMADRVATLDETIARLGGGSAVKKMAAADQAPPLRSDAEDGDPNDDDPLDDPCECSCASCQMDGCDACTNAECADETCAADGCPMQKEKAAASKAAALEVIKRRRRDLDLRSRNL